MEADWEVKIGGGAPVIDALWAGFVDLRRSPERIGEIAEAVAFPALARLLLALNAAGSPLWTAKCDLWKPIGKESAEAGVVLADRTPPAALACYVDLLPVEGVVFGSWQAAETFCRAWVAGLTPIPLPECTAELLVRQAIADTAEGFGVTAYLSAAGTDDLLAGNALEAAMTAFAGAIPITAPPIMDGSKLQLKSVGE
jgi:hypothetical protein